MFFDAASPTGPIPPRRDHNNGRKKKVRKNRRGGATFFAPRWRGPRACEKIRRGGCGFFSRLDGGGLGPGPWAPCLGSRQWESASWAWGPRLWAWAPCPCPGPPVWTERHSEKTKIKSPTQNDSPNDKKKTGPKFKTCPNQKTTEKHGSVNVQTLEASNPSPKQMVDSPKEIVSKTPRLLLGFKAFR